MQGNGKVQAPTPEQIATNLAQQRALLAAHRANARQQLAGMILNGICAGVYSDASRNFTQEFADHVVDDAVILADKLLARLERPSARPEAANGVAPAAAEPGKNASSNEDAVPATAGAEAW